MHEPAPDAPAQDAVDLPDQPADPAIPAPPGFDDLGLAPGLLATLARLGYEEPTPIQRQAIPALLAGGDVLGEAPTGTGKTAAFALPMLQRLAGDGTAEAGSEGSSGPRSGTRPPVRGLVLVPTRELAMQVSEALHRYGATFGMRVLPVYGGQPIGQQLRALERGVDVVVATPGRAVDHLTRGSLSLAEVRVLVLDEADEMLDMGFAEDLEVILGAVPAERQTALFSATMPAAVTGIARRHLRAPTRVRVTRTPGTAGAGAGIRQIAYVVRRPDKLAALCRVLDVEDPTSALVFGRTRDEVDELAERLGSRGHDAAALHGGMSQDQRDRVMARFREGSLDVLVATDVAARGLDIEHVSHVVNFDVPTDPDAYVHRIGRTGRAGRAGTAITLLEPREHRLLRAIEHAVGGRLELAKVPTVADLRERRLELLRAGLREALLQDGSERFRAVVEPLAEEFDVMDIALAAVSMASGAAGVATDEPDIPTLALAWRPVLRDRGAPGAGGRPGVMGSPGAGGGRPGPGQERSGDGSVHAGGPQEPRPRDPDWQRSGPGQPGWTRLWVSGGRRAGMRPGDLVGAITNEAGVPAATIGAITIGDGFSLVDVREDAAELILGAMAGAVIRGRRMEVRRDHGAGGPGDGAPQRRGYPRGGRPGMARPDGPAGPGRAGWPGAAGRPTRGPGPWCHGGPRPSPRPGPRPHRTPPAD